MITPDLLKELNAIAAEEIQEPVMPVEHYVQEAENLYQWCLPDKEKLVAKNLNWALVESIKPRAAICREAQSLWVTERKTQAKAALDWKEKSPHAYELRDGLLHAFTYAFRNDSGKLMRVAEIRSGSGNADMIQDLSDLSVFGKANPNALKAINFDMALLDEAASESTAMASLLAIANGDKDAPSVKKVNRDRAFTFLRRAVDEVRECGKYVFWKEPDRMKGYASDYLRKAKSISKNKKKTDPNQP